MFKDSQIALPQINKELCEHGNPKGVCEVCGGVKKETTEEIIDIESRTRLSQILKSAIESIDYDTCGSMTFQEAMFRLDDNHEISGLSILRSYGNRMANEENMIRLLNFTGVTQNRQFFKKPDFTNQEQLLSILRKADNDIDFKNCSLVHFRETEFGIGTNFQISGEKLLRGFGEKQLDLDNMAKLLNFAGIEVDYLDFSSKEQLRLILSKPDKQIDIKTCSLSEFKETKFGVGTRRCVFGKNILRMFGDNKVNTANLKQLLQFIEVNSEQRLFEAPDYSNPEILRTMLEQASGKIDFNTCGLKEFCQTSFGVGTNFELLGQALLLNFGSKRANTQNLFDLLRFVKIDSSIRPIELVDYSKPEQLRSLLEMPNQSIDFMRCGLGEFKKIKFGREGSAKAGETLLSNFGSKKISTANMIDLLRFAGFAVEDDDLMNLDQLRNMLSRSEPEIDLNVCGVHQFIGTKFGVDGRSPVLGGAILKKFGDTKRTTENMLKLLGSLGYDVEEIDYNNIDHLRKLLEGVEDGINLQTCDLREFLETSFGINTRFEMKGQAILRNFGSKTADTRNMVTFLGLLGIKREQDVSKQNNGESWPAAKEGWLSTFALAKQLKVATATVTRVGDQYKLEYPNSSEMAKPKRGRPGEYYSPELAELIVAEINKFEKSLNGWKTNGILAKELDADYATIKKMANTYRESHPEFFKIMKDQIGRPREHFSPVLIQLLIDELARIERATDEWKTNGSLSIILDINEITTKKLAAPYRDSNPEYFLLKKASNGKIFEHYSPELVAIITEKVTSIENVKPGWKNQGELIRELDVHSRVIIRESDGYRNSNPEYFQDMRSESGQVREYFSPELVKIIKDNVDIFKERIRGKKSKEELFASCESFLSELADGQSLDAQEYQKIVSLCGPSNAVDILCLFRPKFKDIPNERVKGIIAKYLGDFLLSHQGFSVENLEVVKKYLSNNNLREAFVVNLKKSVLAQVHLAMKSGSAIADKEVIGVYINSLKEKAEEIKNEHLDLAIADVEKYYQSIAKLKKPDTIVDSLKEGRVFPDINQLVNIQEIINNGKMLIADDMGLGKSGSAILTKEYLGLRCGLVIAPNNVVTTWQRYLSSDKDENGKQAGYFKQGHEPRVLVIENIEDIENLKKPYDYIIISQEKLNDRYIEALKSIDYDMLIGDEIHKLKNLKDGVRSEKMIELAEKIEGPEKYMAILSGTPAPNKVEDLAMILKLLYPEEFKNVDNKDLVRSLIYSEVVDLRNKLLPRMQMKSLRDSIEMPGLNERVVEFELSKHEQDIYEILLEEDELTATEKLRILRQFVLNPDMLDTTPVIEKTKPQILKSELIEAFKEHDKIVCFFNDYIENVIRGDRSIVNELALAGVEVRVIEGHVPEGEREKIRAELKNKSAKTLLLVSGKTADVGVDFSSADHVIFYNDPWSKYDKKQQLGRVYREGLATDLNSTTLVARNTIEEGIQKYIDAKERAIEKLLRGIPRTEIENRLIEKDERVENGDLELNSELAEYYFSRWDRMMRIFSAVKEMGEQDFVKFLGKYGEEYADCYTELGSRTYQGNNARVTSTLLRKMMEEKNQPANDLRILDIASGPEMLKKHGSDDFKEVISVDINEHHFKNLEGKQLVSSFLNLPIKDNSIDYCNLGLALHYTKLNLRNDVYERLQVLAEMNRVLQVGGRAVISLIHSQDFNKEAFEKVVAEIGFKIVNAYTGDAVSGRSYQSKIITLEKVDDIAEYKSDAMKFASADNEKYIKPLAEKIGKKTLRGLKFTENKHKLKDSRQMITKFNLNGADFEVEFNLQDQAIFEEENEIKEKVAEFKKIFGNIKDVPREEVVNNGFARIATGKNCLIFKRLKSGEGAVVVRD